MREQVKRLKENRSRVVANSINQKQWFSKKKTDFVDNRPETIAQRKLLQVANNSSQNKTTNQLQQIIMSSERNSVVQRGKVKKKTARSEPYPTGTYGNRGKEKKYLEEKFGKKIKGDSTHQSEHVVGYKVIDQVNDRKKSEEGKQHEAQAPAYYEQFQPHREHPGTGTSKTIGPSGFSSETYRRDTRRLIESDGYAEAVQINQLGYAFQDEKTNPRQDDDVAFAQANASYRRMVMGVNEFSHYKDDGTKHTQKITFKEKVEQLLARDIQNKKIPYPWTEQQLSEHLKQNYGIDLSDPRLL